MDKIKAVIFDFDNTLADRSLASYGAYCYLIDTVAPQYQKGTIEYECIIQDLMVWDMHGYYNKEFIVENLEKKYGIHIDFDFAEWWRKYQPEFEFLYDDTIETLLYLKEKGYKLGIITNGPGKSQRYKVMKTGLDQYIDYIVVCGEHDFEKPEKESFDFACKHLGVENYEAIYVGDTYSNDVYGAYKAGLTPIWLWPEGKVYHNDDVICISCMKELKQYL